MKVLMMVIMKNTIRLPGLPPMTLEVNSRVVHNAMIVNIGVKNHQIDPIQGNDNNWTKEYQLHMHKFHRMNGSHRESGGLLVGVM